MAKKSKKDRSIFSAVWEDTKDTAGDLWWLTKRHKKKAIATGLFVAYKMFSSPKRDYDDDHNDHNDMPIVG